MAARNQYSNHAFNAAWLGIYWAMEKLLFVAAFILFSKSDQVEETDIVAATFASGHSHWQPFSFSLMWVLHLFCSFGLWPHQLFPVSVLLRQTPRYRFGVYSPVPVIETILSEGWCCSSGKGLRFLWEVFTWEEWRPYLSCVWSGLMWSQAGAGCGGTLFPEGWCESGSLLLPGYRPLWRVSSSPAVRVGSCTVISTPQPSQTAGTSH